MEPNPVLNIDHKHTVLANKVDYFCLDITAKDILSRFLQ